LTSKSAPRVIKLKDAEFSPRFEYGDQAQVAQLCGADDGSKLGVGIVRMSKSAIPWKIKYDEFILVLEGTITITTEDDELKASAMEAIWLPAGTSLTYISDKALLLYAIHPTDWATRDEPLA